MDYCATGCTGPAYTANANVPAFHPCTDATSDTAGTIQRPSKLFADGDYTPNYEHFHLWGSGYAPWVSVADACCKLWSATATVSPTGTVWAAAADHYRTDVAAC